ncbi:hypothetical protein [Streptomyces sp. G45]|uniref:hypothetical protein n=1 Tax=Streptomyces sp. G45 TaxID=3406627 RepID=UPI003C25421B
MPPEDIVAADEAGHLDALSDGRDPDATVDHRPGCSNPQITESTPHGNSIRTGDPITFTCTTCNATKPL